MITYNVVFITFSTAHLIVCSGFMLSQHPLNARNISPGDRKNIITQVDIISHNHRREYQETQHETLSSLEAKLNDLASLQLQEFLKEKKSKKSLQSNHKHDNDEIEDETFNLSTEDELVRLDILHTRLDIQLNRTYVGPSSIHGRGLFAASDCSAGDLLTCFPGDAIVILDDDYTEIDEDQGGNHATDLQKQEWTVLWADHVKKTKEDEKDYVTANWFLGNLIHAHGENVGIVGVPFLDQDPAYLGHFANDGAPTELIPTCEVECESYMLASNLAANAVNEDIAAESHIVTIATRDIKQGEEIFVTYGPDYWLERQQQRQWKPPVLMDEDTITGTTSTKNANGKEQKHKKKKKKSSSGRGFG